MGPQGGQGKQGFFVESTNRMIMGDMYELASEPCSRAAVSGLQKAGADREVDRMFAPWHVARTATMRQLFS